MKKPHLVLLIVTAIMTLFSAYSLAAINHVYNIDFKWYSQYYSRYTSEQRQTDGDKWYLEEYLKYMKVSLITNWTGLDDVTNETKIKKTAFTKTDFNKYILLYCSLGEVSSPEYRIKVVGIAQRGNVVEVKVSLNSPLELSVDKAEDERKFFPEDVIKIDKSEFSSKGKLFFIFKTQAGKEIDEKYYVIQ